MWRFINVWYDKQLRVFKTLWNENKLFTLVNRVLCWDNENGYKNTNMILLLISPTLRTYSMLRQILHLVNIKTQLKLRKTACKYCTALFCPCENHKLPRNI